MLVSAACFAACGADPPALSEDDAGVVQADAIVPAPPPPPPPEPTTPAPPFAPSSTIAKPALPLFLPCAAGWRDTGRDFGDDDISVCEPWPREGRGHCPEDQAHYPGEPGCAVVGTPCDPNDDFARGLPAFGVLYARPETSAAGSGTKEDPYHRLADAIAAAPEGAIIALSKGHFDETVTLDRSITLWGACTASTIVGSVDVQHGHARIWNARFTGAITTSGHGTAMLSIADVIIEGPLPSGVFARDPTAINGVVIRGPDIGVRVEAPGTLRLTRAVISAFSNSGVSIHGATTATVGHTFFGDAAGIGVRIEEGANVDLPALIIERTSSVAVELAGALTRAQLADSVIREGGCLDVVDGASANLQRVRVENAGVFARASRLNATDLLIRAAGLSAEEGSAVDAERLHVSRARGANIKVASASHLRLIDATIADAGGGIFAQDSSLELMRADLARHSSGLYVAGSTGVRADQLRVRDTLEGPAVALVRVDTSTLSRLRIENSAVLALALDQSAALIEDLTIRAAAQRGLQARSSALQLARVELTSSSGVGLAAFDGTTLDAVDLIARDVAEIGLAVLAESTVKLQRFDISGSIVCGLQAAGSATMELDDGVIHKNGIGLNAEDPSRVKFGRRIIFSENQTDTGDSLLPAPAPAEIRVDL